MTEYRVLWRMGSGRWIPDDPTTDLERVARDIRSLRTVGAEVQLQSRRVTPWSSCPIPEELEHGNVTAPPRTPAPAAAHRPDERVGSAAA